VYGFCDTQLFSPTVMSLTKDAAPAYNAGFTHPTDLRPGKERIVLCEDRGEKC
jgi:hypothetical protein